GGICEHPTAHEPTERASGGVARRHRQPSAHRVAMATCAGPLVPPMSFELILIVAVVAGLVGAMSGMGGGVVLIPALTFFGMDIKRAIAVSIVSVIATSSGSASAYVRDHITNLKVGMFLEMFTMLGALAGASITVAAGLGVPPKVSTTTSNLIIGVTALAGTSVYLANGLIDPGLAAPVILGVTTGAFVGTRILVRLTNETVRRVFLCVLLVLAVEMLLRGLRGR